MRKLARITIVDSITPIENADMIELAHIGGWQCIVKKGQFKAGDKGIYFEIDSFLPDTDKRFEFLKDRCLRKWMQGQECVKSGLRIKTLKLRGVLSQGLLMPIDEFPEVTKQDVDEDLSELLHIEHYDDVCDAYAYTQGTVSLKGNARGNFPSFIPKTDEERLENLNEYFETMKDEEFECTFKEDGSSHTSYFSEANKKSEEDNPFGVCSRNLNLKDNESDENCEKKNIYWEVARQYNLDKSLPQYCKEHNIELAIQGEMVGPGINKDRDKYTEYHLRVFRIWNIGEQRYLTPDERYKVCEDLKLEHVHVYKKHFKFFQEVHNIEEAKKFVDLKTLRGNPLEGIVFKNYNGTIHFKNINNQYLLKEND